MQEVGRVDTARSGHRVGLLKDCERSPEDHAVAASTFRARYSTGPSHTTLVDSTAGEGWCRRPIPKDGQPPPAMRRRRHARPVTTRRPEDWGAAACQHHVSTLSAERPSTTIDRTQPPTVKVLLRRHIRSLSTTSHHAWNTFLNRVSQVRILPGARAHLQVRELFGTSVEAPDGCRSALKIGRASCRERV